jgi:2-succinyl-6-hydroxy-2,4-cyclohexadiene-1-carboxylate synthase
VTLAAEVRGAGPPLVALHGFTGSAAVWRALTFPRRRIVAVDLPGHGASPPPSEEGLPETADALVAVLDRLDVRAADWLGYSLGGRVALHVAVRHPERVRRLVLESTSPGIADPVARAARAADDDALAATIARDGLEAFVDRWMAQPLFRSLHRLPPATLARSRALRLANAPAGLAAALRRLSVGRQTPLWDVLGDVRVPTLLIAGADDAQYAAAARAMAERLSHPTVCVVPNAGHTTHLENPAAFTAAVEAFLSA